MHHLIGALPHHALRNLSRKYGPLMHLQLGEIHAVVVWSPRMAKEFLKVHDLSFAARPELMVSDIVFYRQKDIVFAKYGDYWKQMRKIGISELLSAKMVKSFSSIRQDEVHDLVASIRSTPNGVVNMSEKVLRLTSSVICRSAFGKVWDDRDNLLMIMREVLALSGGFDVADFFPSWTLLHEISAMRSRLLSMHEKIDVILEKIINEHKENQADEEKGHGEFGGEDLIEILLRVMENGELRFPITNDNIKAVILDMFFGETETSSTTIQWTLSELMKNPHAMAKAQAEVRWACKEKYLDDNDLEELKYLKLVIKETLRLHPAAPLLGLRECREETKIDGYTIPLKAKVIVNGWAIARDPKSWDDPENFMPERFENSCVDFNGNHFQFIPFGAGSRMCPGMHFGLANVVYSLAQLLYHFDAMAKAQAEVRWACKGKYLDDNDLEELKYLKLVIKETLRLHPAAPLLGLRECREETKIDGYTIPLKAKVIVNGWAIARDPKSWDDPENFMPERFENSCVDFNGNHFQFIPFGAGSRMCPGMHFGLANVVYSLAQLLYHFDWRLPYGLQPKDLDMTETLGISATRKHDIHLIAIPYDLSQY